MHDVVIVGVPLVVILAGILFSRSDAKELCAEIAALRSETRAGLSKMDDHLGRIDADFRQFYHLTDKLEARMASFDKRG